MKKNVMLVAMVTAFMLTVPLFCIDMPASEGADSEMWTDSGNYDYSWFEDANGMGPFSISTAEELAGLAYLVNVGIDWPGWALPASTFDGDTITLTASVDLSAHIWDPIGFIDPENEYGIEFPNAFRGTFTCAEGVTITGLTTIETESHSTGLFGVIVWGALVKNVTLVDVDVSGHMYAAAGIVGASISGNIENCHVLSGQIHGNIVAGGIVGAVANEPDDMESSYISTIKRCSNKADIYGGNAAGGIVGAALNYDEYMPVEIDKCYNFGNITIMGKAFTEDDFYAGGIAGFCGSGSITESYNAGKVTVTEENSYAGGIAGVFSNMGFRDASSIQIMNCYNTGPVSGKSGVGGIFGNSEGTITTLKCYNAGKITATGDSGPIYGTSDGDANVYDVFWLADSTGLWSGARALADMTGGNALDKMTGLVIPDDEIIPGLIETRFTNTAQSSYAPQLIYFSTGSVSATVKADSLNSVNLSNATPYDGSNDLWTDFGNYDISWFDGGDQDSYDIDTAAKLAGLAWLVKQSILIDFEEITIRLTASLDLSAHLWDPIGFLSTTGDDAFLHTFRGTFTCTDGVEISGLITKDTGAAGVGLFGSIGEEARIENVILKNVNLTGIVYVGGIAGASIGGTIENCHVLSGTITSELGGVGGIIGVGGNTNDNYEGLITKCSNRADVSGPSGVGGIMGGLPYNATNEKTSLIYHCYNYGNVTGTGTNDGRSVYVGGIIGFCFEGSVESSYNAGKVSSEGEDDFVGGIAGMIKSTYMDATIQNVYNTGDVSGNSVVGGIVGTTMNTVNVFNCYNAGTITGNGDIGPIFGKYNERGLSVENVYWLAETTDMETGARALADMTGGNALSKMNGLERNFVNTALDSFAPQLAFFASDEASNTAKADSLASVDLTVAQPYVPSGDGDDNGDDNLMLYISITAIAVISIIAVAYFAFLRK